MILGSSGHAKVIIDIVEQEGRYGIAGLLDRYRMVGEQTLGYPILGKEADLSKIASSHQLGGVIVAVGDNHIRSQVVARVKVSCPGLRFVRAVHPRGSIAEGVDIGEGSVIMAGVVISPGCSIGRFCIVNTNASLDHDSCMDEFSSLGPRASVAGTCRIGAYSAIGIGAVMVPDIHVGEHAVIGAGSTVLSNVESFKVAFGTPARVVRDRKPGDEYM